MFAACFQDACCHCCFWPKILRQEFYDEAFRREWAPSAFWEHLTRMFSTHISTKECLEDLFSYLADHARDQKNPVKVSAERQFLMAPRGIRWDPNEYPLCNLLPGDMAHQEALKYSVGRHVFQSRQKFRAETVRDGRDFFKKGRVFLLPESVKREQPSHRSGCFFGTGVKCPTLALPFSGASAPAKTISTKPASLLSDLRAVAAAVALTHQSAEDFRDLSALWCGCLLQMGSVFYRNQEEDFLLSLGFHSQAALCWRLDSYAPPNGEPAFFWPRVGANAKDFLVWVTLTKLESRDNPGSADAFQGVPTETCHSTQVCGIFQPPARLLCFFVCAQQVSIATNLEPRFAI